MDLGLTGKVAIITGGSEGIGKAAAHRMAAEGARAVIVARRPEVLEAAARDIEKSTGGVVLPIRGDVAEQETVNRALETTLDRFGRVDILVNNAGVSMAKSFEEVTDEDWESEFSLKACGVPLGRVGEGQEAGDVIAFLASERASYLTGIAINIDGGSSPVV